MKTIRMVALASLLLCWAPLIGAQTFAEVRQVINDAGHRCDRVENVRAAGTIGPAGDVLLIIDCSDGSSHVIRVTPRHEVQYFLRCGFLNPVKCD